jgi:hypothetical protein
MNTEERILYVDAQDHHASESNVLALHPSKLSFLSLVQNGAFDRAVIQNVATSELSSLGFFYIGNALKKEALLEVLVHQPIAVMQSLEAEEIEAVAKLAGYSDIKISPFQIISKQGGKDTKFSTVKLTMVCPKKVLLANK